MGNTLERLRALNSKIEEKLKQKQSDKKESIKVDTSSAPVIEIEATKEESSISSFDDNMPIIIEKEIPLSSEQKAVELAMELIDVLGFDPEVNFVRTSNIISLASLYISLNIEKKVENFNDIMIYKAMNISGIGLKEDDFGEIREGKYVQVIAITYEPDKNGKKKAKNISLGYFGKAETLDADQKRAVIEFVLRWRYEKAFQNMEHYKNLLTRIENGI